MWTQKFCLICIYILRNYAFQISNEALFLAFLQPVANRLKSFIPPSRRLVWAKPLPPPPLDCIAKLKTTINARFII